MARVPVNKTIKKATKIIKKAETKAIPIRGNFKKHKEGKPELDAKIADHNVSVFKSRLVSIKKSNKKHNYSETALLKMYKGLLDMLLSLIPIAEVNYRQYKLDRSSYALSTLINQAREVTNDMRAINDFTNQAEKIVEMTRRQFTLIAQQLVDESYKVKKFVRANSRASEREKLENIIDQLVQAHGRYLNESVKSLASTILEYMTDRQVGKSNTSHVGSSHIKMK